VRQRHRAELLRLRQPERKPVRDRQQIVELRVQVLDRHPLLLSDMSRIYQDDRLSR
jgi:hypothetical protein